MWQSALSCALAIGFLIPANLHLPAQQQTVRVLKISSGPSGGETNGKFVFSSERSVFNRHDDREVIVLFEWEGTSGAHRLVAQWRSPDSAVTSTSAIDYVATAQRFGAYWTLPVSPSMSLGTWSIEATIDGMPAGRFTFEVTENKVASPPVKHILTQAELYERLNRAFIVLTRSSTGVGPLGATAGFSATPGVIYTAMSTLDNTDDIRMVSRDGSTKPVTAAVAWNRRQHWAVLSGTVNVDVLPIAPDATKVGTRCFSLEATPAGRVLSECTITGQSDETTGPPLTATFAASDGAPGAPVLNEFGELIGLVGDVGRPGEAAIVYRYRGPTLGTPIVPMTLVKFDVNATPVPLNDLRSRGITIPAIVGGQNVMTGGFGRVDVKGKLESPEHHDEMSVREKSFAIFVMWTPKERLRGQMVVRVFDADNRPVAESKPVKVDFRKGQTSSSSWTLRMIAEPGTYRADVLLDATPMWRGFVRITP